MQLQLVDLRPAARPSVRERECLELVERVTAGERVTAREAVRLLPGRPQFAALWRAILRLDAEEPGNLARMQCLRRLSQALDGEEPFLRTVLGLEVFAERGLVTLTVREDMMIVHPVPGRRADLEQSVYIKALRRALGETFS